MGRVVLVNCFLVDRLEVLPQEDAQLFELLQFEEGDLDHTFLENDLLDPINLLQNSSSSHYIICKFFFLIEESKINSMDSPQMYSKHAQS